MSWGRDLVNIRWSLIVGGCVKESGSGLMPDSVGSQEVVLMTGTATSDSRLVNKGS